MKQFASGDGTLVVDDFGNASAFLIGKDNHLARKEGTIQWVSINDGPVQRVDGTAYSIAIPLVPAWTNAGSTVLSNTGDLQIDYSHTLADFGTGLVSWFFSVTLTNLTTERKAICYYHYANLDLFGTPDNDVSVYTGMDPDVGLPAYRPIIDADHPDQIFAYRTYVRRDAWAQFLNPDLRNLIEGFKNSGTLPHEQQILEGDITGAFQYNQMLQPCESMSIILEIGRIE